MLVALVEAVEAYADQPAFGSARGRRIHLVREARGVRVQVAGRIQPGERAHVVQEVIETCCKDSAFKSKMLFVATGQSALSDTPNLQRLMGRFVVKVQLADTDVDIRRVDIEDESAMQTTVLRFTIAVHDQLQLESALRALRRNAAVRSCSRVLAP